MQVSPHLKLSLGLIVLSVGVIGSMALGLYIGVRPVDSTLITQNFGHILRNIFNPLELPADLRVITEGRIPRSITGVIAGACIGVAGALIQGHTKNPLADPGILGISHGAALAIVLCGSFLPLVGAAFAGALAATLLVFTLASSGGAPIHPPTLILAGAALSAVFGACTTIVTLLRSDALNQIRFWTVGAFNMHNMATVLPLVPLAVIGLVAALATGPTLNLLNLGDTMAESLGVNTARARLFGMLLIAFLAAVATTLAGPVAFLGLIVPQMARAICGADYRWILPYALLIGALIAMVADIAGRIIARPGEVEVGIVTAFIGAPIFLYLLMRNKVVRL